MGRGMYHTWTCDGDHLQEWTTLPRTRLCSLCDERGLASSTIRRVGILQVLWWPRRRFGPCRRTANQQQRRVQLTSRVGDRMSGVAPIAQPYTTAFHSSRCGWHAVRDRRRR